jgi:Pyruvate/2-oxoacid:ferredoxin oxidoreductase delta subunit
MTRQRGTRTRAGRDTTEFIMLDRSRCEACWECIAVCPEAVFGKVDVWLHRHAVVRTADACSGCRRCIKVCACAALSDRRQTDVALPQEDTASEAKSTSLQMPPCGSGIVRLSGSRS